MKSKASRAFWRAHEKLPRDVQRQARRAYLLWRDNPNYPALQFKKVSDVRPLYSCRIMNTGYRVLGTLQGDVMTWRWIGPHDEYDRLIG